jgi:hypothetical protein
MVDDAMDIGQALLAGDPDDPQLRQIVEDLRTGPRDHHGRAIRQEFTNPRMSIVVMAGDLFDQHDAHLVVGFTDTFDTSDKMDIVINRKSVQSQLVRRLYGEDHKRLDRALLQALRHLPRAGVETRGAKRRGKLVRYPLGTVAVLNLGGQRIFAVAYSRMGNDMVARSSMADLESSLNQLWPTIRTYGQLGPVAMPLVGSGLARIGFGGGATLLRGLITSFVSASREQFVCRELRVMINPNQANEIDMLELAGFLRAAAGRAAR